MQTNDTGENYGPLDTGVCSQVHKRFYFYLNSFVFLIKFMRSYFSVHSKGESILCAHQKNLKHTM